MMVFVFAVLWTLATILLITNPKYEAASWIALTLFVAGGGALSLTITENVLPYLRHFQIGANALELILFPSVVSEPKARYCLKVVGAGRHRAGFIFVSSFENI